MHKLILALGSNVGDKHEHLTRAIYLLTRHIKDIRYSKFYETTPMYFTQQASFLNGALAGSTTLTPLKLLEFVKELEVEIGRQKRFANGPREIDIDILYYDDLIYSEPTLIIPHPGIAHREFVLRPLMDIAPDFIHPILGRSTSQLFFDITSTAANPEDLAAEF
jgi:2-amino-4-hydroxy-6-hydroxymethyldihydropteridine diphosphokinase